MYYHRHEVSVWIVHYGWLHDIKDGAHFLDTNVFCTNTFWDQKDLNWRIPCVNLCESSPVEQCTDVENDQFSSGGSRPLGLDALLLMKVPNLFIVLKLYRNLRFLRNFEYYLMKTALRNV